MGYFDSDRGNSGIGAEILAKDDFEFLD